MEPLLIVEDAFVVRGPGVQVLPRFTVAAPSPGAIFVRLVRPDGTAREATATIDVAHMKGALAPYAMYRLHGVDVDDVPVGTAIFAR